MRWSIPLMLTSLVGFAVSRLVCHEGVYHALTHNFINAEIVRSVGVDVAAEPSA